MWIPLARKLAFLRKNFRSCQRKIKIGLYLTYGKPILALVWTPHTRYAINKLQNVQRRATRFVMPNYFRASKVTEILNSLKWNSIELRNKELRLLTFYKIIHNCENWPLPNEIHISSRATRGNQLKLVQLSPRIDVYKYSFYPNVIQLWNNLPHHITSGQSFDS